jgi:hypothetical protein
MNSVLLLLLDEEGAAACLPEMEATSPPAACNELHGEVLFGLLYASLHWRFLPCSMSSVTLHGAVLVLFIKSR